MPTNAKQSGKLRSAARNCKQGKYVNISNGFSYPLNHCRWAFYLVSTGKDKQPVAYLHSTFSPVKIIVLMLIIMIARVGPLVYSD